MQRRRGELGAVLFTDIVGSTSIAAEMGNRRWVELVARHERVIRGQLKRFGGRERDTAGDGFFATFERPADAIRCAVASAEAVRELGIEIRVGVAFGELESAGRKPGGLVVNTAARVMAVAGAGEVLVPASVRDIVVGSGISFEEHGVHQLKGLDGEFRLFKVVAVDGKAPPPPLDEAEAAERLREIFPVGSRRRALLVGSGAALVALVVLAIVAVASRREAPSAGPASGPLERAVARIDESGSVRSTVSVAGIGPGEPHGLLHVDTPLAVGQGGVWILRPPVLLHVDPRHLEVRPDLIDVGVGESFALVTGHDAVWVQVRNVVYRINPATDERDIFLQVQPTSAITTYSLALSDALWFAVSDGTLVRMDPRTGARDQIDTGWTIDGLAASREIVWIADAVAGKVVRFDAGTLRQIGRPVPLRGNVDQIAAAGDRLWILDHGVGLVTRIDASTGRIDGSARVGEDPTQMAVGAEAVWIGDERGSVFRVDAATLEATEIPVGAEVRGVAVDPGEGSVWIYVGERVRASG